MSGGEITKMLNDILHPSQKDHIPAVGGVNDATGWKRLEKINSFIQQSPPLKPWSHSESKVRNGNLFMLNAVGKVRKVFQTRRKSNQGSREG